MVGLVFLSILVIIAVGTMVIDLVTQNEIYNNYVINQDLVNRLKGPSLEHPFGTDNYGRDILSRVIYGTRISLGIGLLAVAISCVIGIIIGAIAGFYGSVTDNILMRLVDIMLAIPSILL